MSRFVTRINSQPHLKRSSTNCSGCAKLLCRTCKHSCLWTQFFCIETDQKPLAPPPWTMKDVVGVMLVWVWSPRETKALDMDEFVRLFSSKHGNRKIVILLIKFQHLQLLLLLLSVYIKISLWWLCLVYTEHCDFYYIFNVFFIFILLLKDIVTL